MTALFQDSPICPSSLGSRPWKLIDDPHLFTTYEEARDAIVDFILMAPDNSYNSYNIVEFEIMEVDVEE